DVAVGLLLRVLQVRGVVARRQVRFGEGGVEAPAGRERDGPLPALLAWSLNHDGPREAERRERPPLAAAQVALHVHRLVGAVDGPQIGRASCRERGGGG